MGTQRSRDSVGRFASYLEGLAGVIGHAARVGPMRDYCTGLLLPCERKSVEPIAAATAPERVGAQHQALLHFVAEGAWSDEAVLAKVREMVLPQIQRHGPIEAWIIDDTSFPKHGSHSVGVTHQYCGQLGKQENCQVAVSLSVANHHASLPVAYRLYLPKSWAEDAKRRKKAGVPDVTRGNGRFREPDFATAFRGGNGAPFEDRRHRSNLATLSLLCDANRSQKKTSEFMTQYD